MKKIDSSGIVANSFAKFTVLTGGFRPHILHMSLQYLVVFKNYSQRLRYCVAAAGRHFEHSV